MRILISADMEGATGVTWTGDVTPGAEQWQRFRKLFTADVNACVAGLAHTYLANSIVGVRLDGEPASEGRLNAALAAEYRRAGAAGHRRRPHLLRRRRIRPEARRVAVKECVSRCVDGAARLGRERAADGACPGDTAPPPGTVRMIDTATAAGTATNATYRAASRQRRRR